MTLKNFLSIKLSEFIPPVVSENGKDSQFKFTKVKTFSVSLKQHHSTVLKKTHQTCRAYNG